MRLSNFSVILTMVVLMVVGAALTPMIDVGIDPVGRQGKTLAINVSWPDVSAKVVEQSVTAPIEGLVSSLKGIANVSSNSYFGRSEVIVELKPEADVSSTRFEISSLLRQAYSRLPTGVGYPTLSGGEVRTAASSHNEERLLLTYLINADMQPDAIKDYVERNVSKPLARIPGLSRVEVTGTTERYIEITYSPDRLAACGLTSSHIADAIRNFIGRDEIIGEIRQTSASGVTAGIALRLATAEFAKSLEQMPIANVGGKVFYLNDLATFAYRDYEPDYYYRVNGMNTIYLNVYVPADAKVIPLSDAVQEAVEQIKASVGKGVYVKLGHDAAKQQREELFKLVSRTLLSLLLLLLFIWLTSRSLKYLAIIAVALAANLLVAAIAYWLFGVPLHLYSLAGITVSLGLIIDSTIVMADHYSYYHNRRAFQAILAALLTTIGALLVIFFLPKELQDNLYDFGWVIIINLTISLLVAYFFVPSLVDSLRYSSQRRRLRHGRAVVRWNRCYAGYLRFTARRRWIYYVLLVLAFGIPVFALPSRLGQDENTYSEKERQELRWYERLYNGTLGSRFFQTELKEKLSVALGGSMRLFAKSLEDQTARTDDEEKVLHVRAQMPLGGKASQLNEKIRLLEEFLKTFDEIKTFTTEINGRGARVDVKFRDEWEKTSFPYILENKVISKLINIGGADWSTWGISPRGFSNALNLQYRQDRIVVSGFNYSRLYRIAEDICDYMGANGRVKDLIIETPGRQDEEDEFYMRYSGENFALTGQTAAGIHQSLAGMLRTSDVGHYRDRYVSGDIYLRPTSYDDFDLWSLHNAAVATDSASVSVPDLMRIERRAAKSTIHRENQEYVLNVAFNILGSYSFKENYIKGVMEHFSRTLPIGFNCSAPAYSWSKDEGAQYGLILLVVVIIFFICAVLFESLRATVVIISIIPVTLIGTFLTFYLTGAQFGAGGFASLVLLCGITVNSGIYILNQYNLIRRNARGGKDPVRQYVRAYNHKIVPVFLTVASTITGLVPFFIDGDEEPFWFAFATGVSGGLVFSFLAIVLVMPLFIPLGRRIRRRKP